MLAKEPIVAPIGKPEIELIWAAALVICENV